MQKIATRIFIVASVVFGIVGMLFILTAPTGNGHSSDLNNALFKLLFSAVFVILPSFALSIAGKYLNGK